MLKKNSRLLLCVSSLILLLAFSSINAFASPVYYKQNILQSGNSVGTEGGDWYSTKIPSAVAESLNKDGCALSSIAMVLYPNTAYIKDIRVGTTSTYVEADPYSVYVANGNKIKAQWDLIRSKFGLTKANKQIVFPSTSSNAKTKASTIAKYLDQGYYPIIQTYKNTLYHYVVAISHSIPDSNRVTSPINGTDYIESDLSSLDESPVSTVTNADISQSISDATLLEQRWDAERNAVIANYNRDLLLSDSITLEQYLAANLSFSYEKNIRVNDPMNRKPTGVGGPDIPFYKSVRAPEFKNVPKLFLFTY